MHPLTPAEYLNSAAFAPVLYAGGFLLLFHVFVCVLCPLLVCLSSLFRQNVNNAHQRRMSFTPRMTKHSKVFDWSFATRERTVTQGKLEQYIPKLDGVKERQKLMQSRLKMLEEQKEESSETIKKQKEQYEVCLLV